LFDLVGLSQAPALADAAHESIPLYHLRRILTAEEMARVEAYLDTEEDQYLEALARKFSNAAADIRKLRRPAKPRGRTPIPK
jgi:hypothetical protein